MMPKFHLQSVQLQDVAPIGDCRCSENQVRVCETRLLPGGVDACCDDARERKALAEAHRAGQQASDGNAAHRNAPTPFLLHDANDKSSCSGRVEQLMPGGEATCCIAVAGAARLAPAGQPMSPLEAAPTAAGCAPSVRVGDERGTTAAAATGSSPVLPTRTVSGKTPYPQSTSS